jgi:TolB-like protein
MPATQTRAEVRPKAALELATQQLERILASGVMGQAESLTRLLRYLVEETLAGRAECLKEYTLGVEVFRRGADFDPRIDTIVRAQVRRLRAKLHEYYSGQGKTSDILIDIPKGTYVPVFIHRSDPAQAASAEARRPRVTPRFVIAAGVVALVAAVALHPPGAKTGAGHSVAVLPFADLTGDATHRSLADAVSEQVSEALARNSAIRIASRTSTLQYKGAGADVRKLGTSLGVVAIVEGSVQTAGDGLRITAHLVKTDDGYRLWSKSWKGRAAELDHVAEEAARGIAGALGIQVAGSDQMRRRDPEVYRFYLKGRLGQDDRAFAYLDEALRRDPHFAPAWLGKAELYLERVQHAAAPPASLLPKAREAALRALETGEDVAGAHVVLANAAAIYDWNWDEAAKQYQRALELEPEAEYTHLQYALLLAARGRTNEALDAIQRVRKIGGSASTFAAGEAAVYYFTRQYDRAIDHCRTVLDSAPNDLSCHFWMGRAYLSKGMAQEAVASLGRFIRVGSMGFASPITAYLAAGRRADALRLRGDAQLLSTHAYVSPVSLAQMHFAFGEMGAGFRELERALQVRDQSLPGLGVDPIYDGVRSDPRFKRALRRLNL